MNKIILVFACSFTFLTGMTSYRHNIDPLDSLSLGDITGDYICESYRSESNKTDLMLEALDKHQSKASKKVVNKLKAIIDLPEGHTSKEAYYIGLTQKIHQSCPEFAQLPIN